MSNPFLVGERGPHCLLPPRACYLLERAFGRELADLRRQLRGVDQETAFALIALSVTAKSFVAPEEQLVANSQEQAAKSEWLSTSEAALSLGFQSGPRGVVQAISRGQLPAVKTAGRWFITRQDLERYRTEHNRCRR